MLLLDERFKRAFFRAGPSTGSAAAQLRFWLACIAEADLASSDELWLSRDFTDWACLELKYVAGKACLVCMVGGCAAASGSASAAGS